jgi:hypothetical protein
MMETMMVDRPKESEGIRGWLLVYVVALALITVHGMALTMASINVYTRPSAAGAASSAALKSLSPLSALLLYDITNVLLIMYAIVLFILMFRRRKTAIAHNIIFNAISVLLLVGWHFTGTKSDVGTLVDALPGLVSLWYFLVSKRVRTTFTNLGFALLRMPQAVRASR